MTPSWLRVERATIFFKSVSQRALRLAIIMVIGPTNTRYQDIQFLKFNNSPWRIIRNTPAVTNVEEWTRAETGVGAAIAAGSQEENGIWALLVHAAITIMRLSSTGIFSNL
jgi:hypothetical protein